MGAQEEESQTERLELGGHSDRNRELVPKTRYSLSKGTITYSRQGCCRWILSNCTKPFGTAKVAFLSWPIQTQFSVVTP